MYRQLSLSDQIFEKLEHDILTGKYSYGEILTEARLAEDLGVSRTPVREAVRNLLQENILRETGKGLFVQGITHDDISDIMEIRLRTEGIAARYAAARMSAEQKEALKEAVDLQEYYFSKNDTEKMQQTDNVFHELIYAGSGSYTLEGMLVPLHRKATKYRLISLKHSGRPKESLSEHRKICDAILSGDENGADTAMTEHIKLAMLSILAGD